MKLLKELFHSITIKHTKCLDYSFKKQNVWITLSFHNIGVFSLFI